MGIFKKYLFSAVASKWMRNHTELHLKVGVLHMWAWSPFIHARISVRAANGRAEARQSSSSGPHISVKQTTNYQILYLHLHVHYLPPSNPFRCSRLGYIPVGYIRVQLYAFPKITC